MDKLYSEQEIRLHYRYLTELLIEKGITITSMESITSGQFISLITDSEGSSAITKGGLVTYSNDMKTYFGVPGEVIDEFSVYSNETSKSMASSVKDIFKSDIAVGITGTAGNIDPNNESSSVPGVVYFTIIYKDNVLNKKICIPYEENRLMFKLAVCEEVYKELITLI